jgi:HK97 family phage prohead protease
MSSSGIQVSGRPIIYDIAYTVHDALGSFTEVMRPGVVSQLIGNTDTRFLLNHSTELLPLARTTSGTLVLRDGPDALRFTATLDPRQSLANDLAVAIERGDISQMSVGFVVEADEWNDDYSKRTITKISDLLDVSAVSFPASPTTSIGLTNGAGMATNSAGFPLNTAQARAKALRLQAHRPVSRMTMLRLLNEAGRMTPAKKGKGR